MCDIRRTLSRASVALRFLTRHFHRRRVFEPSNQPWACHLQPDSKFGLYTEKAHHVTLSLHRVTVSRPPTPPTPHYITGDRCRETSAPHERGRDNTTTTANKKERKKSSTEPSSRRGEFFGGYDGWTGGSPRVRKCSIGRAFINIVYSY